MQAAPVAKAELGYDPWDPAFIADPYPALARLRDEAPLAKLELEILFGRILADLPRLELLDEPRWKPRFVLRGLEAMRVRA